MSSPKLAFCAAASFLALAILACAGTPTWDPAATPTTVALNREASIPPAAVKLLPQSDQHPPLLHSPDFEKPVPVPGGVNTPGAEDSPFILPDGNTLYFFFTPDLSIPAEKQVADGVTGLYRARKVGLTWERAERVLLQDPGKLALDGCEFISGDTMWFCSTREGYAGIHWFTASDRDGRWRDWKAADFDPAYQVGELHFSADGSELYFHSDRPGGQGQLDLWVSQQFDGKWQPPVNLAAVNSPDSEGWPALHSNGKELWFTRNHAIWRSRQVNGAWQTPEKILSDLAGEPSLDAAGNLYFVHHFLKDDKIVEADIYVAYKK